LEKEEKKRALDQKPISQKAVLSDEKGACLHYEDQEKLLMDTENIKDNESVTETEREQWQILVIQQDAVIAESKELIATQDTLIATQDSMIENQKTAIANQDTLIANQKTVIENQDTVIAKQDAVIAEKQAEIADKDAEITLLRTQLNKNS